jgi:thiol-disulfide isomerase/thioredoxin
MKSTSWFTWVVAGLGLATASLTWAGTTDPTLKIGDPAPPLQAMSWIKGKPLPKLEPGRVYVVEFWATWCVPCKEQMPHLSALQEKHAANLTVVGVDARETQRGDAHPDAVRKFVEKQGDRMAYTVAVDDPQKETIFNAWMTAAGAYGLPTSFIVDRQGRVVWVGHPIGSVRNAFDAAVEQALKGESDLAAARELQKDLNRETAARLGK